MDDLVTTVDLSVRIYDAIPCPIEWAGPIHLPNLILTSSEGSWYHTHSNHDRSMNSLMSGVYPNTFSNGVLPSR